MSYILDALKKADAERERSAVPGLHAHPQDDPAGREQREGGLPWPAIAIVAMVLLGGALAWLLLSDRGVRTPPLMAETPTLPPPAPSPAPAPARMSEPAAVAAPAPIAPAVIAAPTPAPQTTAPASAAAPVARVAPPKPAAPPPAPKPAAPAEPRLPSLNELPADVRASLPPLSISAAVYSPTPSARMLFINGQVLREGQDVADGIKIERIGPSASVLSARGVRFEVKH